MIETTSKKKPEVKKYDNNGNELAIRFGLGGVKAVGVGIMEDLVKNREESGNFKDIYDFSGRLGTKIINKKSIEALSKGGAFDNIHKNRNQIFQSCEIIGKYAAFKEEEKSSNQMSLFGAGSSVTIDNPSLKDVSDWEQQDKLQKEFEAFGFFVNEHPLDDSVDDLKKRGVIFSEYLEGDGLSDGNIVKMAGVLASSKHRSGPRGRYAYLYLSDPHGIYEMAIFDEALITNSRDLMEAGQTLVVESLVRKDEGGIRLLVKSLTKLDDFIKNTRAKKEAFQDIKQQKKRNFDWKDRNSQAQESAAQNLIDQKNREERLEALKNKIIIPEVTIIVKNRDMMFNIKGFLSQKLAPPDFDKVSKVFLEIGDDASSAKVELPERYLLDENDEIKIKSLK